jgi:hypothetical protein
MLCRTRLEHEDTFVHGAMLARRPGSAATRLGDHEHHQWAFVEIENTACAVAESVGAARRTAAQKLYALLSERAELFVNARPAMPPAVFDAGLARVKNHLNGRDWFKLQLALAPVATAA